MTTRVPLQDRRWFLRPPHRDPDLGGFFAAAETSLEDAITEHRR